MYVVTGAALIARFCLTETGLFTFYNKNGNMEFGPLDDIQTWGYLICDILLTVMAGIKLADRNEYTNREKNRKLFFASLIITAVVLIYVLFYLPYVIWLGYLMAILYLFTGFQSMLIYNDELTSLSNRRRMLRDIKEFSKDTNQESKTFGYILIDINSFKQVNDTHGHNEGDRALTIVSSVLDLVSRKNDAKAYRIGGDEFAVLASLSDEGKAQEICDEISADLHKRNSAETLPYDLSVSCGYAIYGQDTMTDLSSVMEKADQRMYECKRRKKRSS